MVCPWNRFAEEGDPAFGDQDPLRSLSEELTLSTQEFNQRFKRSPIKRAKRRGYLRNIAVALGNMGSMVTLPVLQNASNDEEPMLREHAQWAIARINERIEATQEEEKRVP
jgi:epoxyqueuosine reductase